MNRDTGLLTSNPYKLFFKYLIPSISATLVTSIYLLADSIIIGKGVGSDGLAALNLLLPLFSLYSGLGTLFGVGGGVLISMYNGSGDRKCANTFFTVSTVCIAAVSLLMLIFSVTFFKPLLFALGATEESYPLVAEYSRYLVGFSFVFSLSNFLQTIVRNDHAPKTAMIAVISGGVANVILDLIFIYLFDWGMAGGAIATVIGSLLTVCILLTHFFSSKCTLSFVRGSICLKNILRVLHSGAASFLMEISAGIVTFVLNLQILKLIGNTGIVIYSVIANSSLIANSFFNGVAQASQPLIATNYGARAMERVQKILRIAALISAGLGIFFTGIGILFPARLIQIFVFSTPEILNLGESALRIYFCTFLFINLNILLSTYFQSVIRPTLALIMNLLRGLFLSTLFAFVFPALFGTSAIWFVMPAAECITLLLGAYFFYRSSRTAA
ncbi:MAG TPA: polysaccharide biosynthesis C-terminal domain-containing protein [Firmicutes bacterium]|nr:polysaccharide biosynthesis C-terminal domain-containing protein [Bacillota bacterium]